MGAIYRFMVLATLICLTKAGKIEKELDINFNQHEYEIKFERVELARYNKDLIDDVSVVTFKYNRTAPAVNATFFLKVDVGRDITGIHQAYTFLSNEYRHFPMRFAVNGCKGLTANFAGTSGLIKCGNFTGCPVLKGRYRICNWYPDASKLPPLRYPVASIKLKYSYFMLRQKL